MARLERVSLRDASIVLVDEATDLTWTAPSADLTLNLDEAAILGQLSAELQVRDLETRIEMELFHHRESKMGSAAIGFSGLNLVKLSFIAPELEEFAGLRVPLSGTIAFDVAPGGILSGVAFDIAGGEGEIALPEVFPAPVPVRRLAAAGSVDGEFSRLVLDSFVIDTDRPSFYLDGTLWQSDAGIGLKGRFQAHDIPFDTLGTYWPETLHPGRTPLDLAERRRGRDYPTGCRARYRARRFREQPLRCGLGGGHARFRRRKRPLPAPDAAGGGRRRQRALHGRRARHHHERRPGRRHRRHPRRGPAEPGPLGGTPHVGDDRSRRAGGGRPCPARPSAPRDW